MPAYEFGSRQAANQFRDRAGEQYLQPDDSRVEKTVRVSGNAPDSIQQRAESAALGSQTSDREGAGRAKLTEKEKETLRRTTSFTWQQNGFEAMAVKAAVQSKGVTEWQDFYEPGEGVESALRKVRDAKGGAAQSAANTAIGGRRMDAQEQDNIGRRARQTERAQAEQVGRAKAPAVVERDSDAIGFIREEQQFGGDVFDIAFSETDRYGRPVGSGSDMSLLEERNQQRSQRARTVDEQKSANVTRDPIAWSQSPNTLDFPGIDTIDPEKTHAARSERAQEKDESELAPRADTPAEWAADPDEFDWPGVDTPPAMGLGPNEESPAPVPERNSERPNASLAALGPEGQEDPTDEPGVFLSERDVSLAPDEAFNGTGAVSPQALGGNDEVRGGERAPRNEPEAPPGFFGTRPDSR